MKKQHQQLKKKNENKTEIKEVISKDNNTNKDVPIYEVLEKYLLNYINDKKKS